MENKNKREYRHQVQIPVLFPVKYRYLFINI